MEYQTNSDSKEQPNIYEQHFNLTFHEVHFKKTYDE